MDDYDKAVMNKLSKERDQLRAELEEAKRELCDWSAIAARHSADNEALRGRLKEDEFREEDIE